MPSYANQIACDHPKQRAHSHLQRQAAAQLLAVRCYNHQDAMAACQTMLLFQTNVVHAHALLNTHKVAQHTDHYQVFLVKVWL